MVRIPPQQQTREGQHINKEYTGKTNLLLMFFYFQQILILKILKIHTNTVMMINMYP